MPLTSEATPYRYKTWTRVYPRGARVCVPVPVSALSPDAHMGAKQDIHRWWEWDRHRWDGDTQKPDAWV